MHRKKTKTKEHKQQQSQEKKESKSFLQISLTECNEFDTYFHLFINQFLN